MNSLSTAHLSAGRLMGSNQGMDEVIAARWVADRASAGAATRAMVGPCLRRNVVSVIPAIAYFVYLLTPHAAGVGMGNWRYGLIGCTLTMALLKIVLVLLFVYRVLISCRTRLAAGTEMTSRFEHEQVTLSSPFSALILPYRSITRFDSKGEWVTFSPHGLAGSSTYSRDLFPDAAIERIKERMQPLRA